jgi:hypothetical protein
MAICQINFYMRGEGGSVCYYRNVLSLYEIQLFVVRVFYIDSATDCTLCVFQLYGFRFLSKYSIVKYSRMSRGDVNEGLGIVEVLP